jgi:hypothetical protein
MSLRRAYTPKSKQQGIAGGPSGQSTSLAPILERLIATLNRIEGKLDKLEN